MKSAFDPAVDERIRRLVLESGIPLRDFSAAAAKSTSEVLQWWSRSGASLQNKNIDSLSQFFGISQGLLVDPTQPLPSDLVRERLYQGPKVLPEVYAHDASSFVRSSAHIVEYVSLTRGRRFMDKILIDMNVHPLIFDDLNNRINLQFMIDLLNRLHAIGMSEREIESLGCYVFLRIQQTELGRKFAQARNYREVYEVLSDTTSAFDSNFDYRIEIDTKEMRMYAKPSQGERFITGRSAGNFFFPGLQKRKLIGWLPILADLAPVNIETAKCVTRGDDYCLYKFELASTPARPTSRLRLLGNA